MSKKTFLYAGLGAVTVGLIIFLAANAHFKDLFLAATYQPTAQAAALQESLSLTSSAERIYQATHPELIATDFADYCSSTDPTASVLGCYTDGRIYVYDIQSDELPGITEATAAHELLHAVWERLSAPEKDALMDQLNDVYKAHYDELKIIATYPELSQASELYARIGSEIADLPENLENHYARYFGDRAKIVAFYHQYADIFSELSCALKTIETEVETLYQEISELKTAYESAATAFATEATEFNNCAATTGCFSQATFTKRRSELLAKQASLDATYATLTSKIERHNQLVAEYNANILRHRDLTAIINSNQERETLND